MVGKNAFNVILFFLYSILDLGLVLYEKLHNKLEKSINHPQGNSLY